MNGLPPLELLEEHHTFPGRYTFKLIGNTNSNLEADAIRVGGEVSGFPDEVTTSVKKSSKGKFSSVTLSVYVKTAHQIHALYVELRKIDGLRFIA